MLEKEDKSLDQHKRIGGDNKPLKKHSIKKVSKVPHQFSTEKLAEDLRKFIH